MIRFWFAAIFAVFTPIMALVAEEPQGEDLNTQLMRATVKISHNKSTGTGFVLTKGNKHLLVTAAHVFDNTPGDETAVVFRSNQAEGEYNKEPTTLVIRKDGKPLWTKHPTEDVAGIWVVPPKNADLPQLTTDLLATDDQLRKHKIHPGDHLACLGYPHRVEASKAGFPLLRDGPIASFPLVPTAKTKTFFMSMNTFEGDSGGPVYLVRPGQTNPGREVRLIVGLVSGQQFLDEEAKMIYGTTKLRHRLGLAIVVHASFIKETVDLLKQAALGSVVKTFAPGPTPNAVRAADGRVLTVPDGWILLPPGDDALTRRVKTARDHWVVQEKRGRKVFSKGMWAPAITIDRIRADLEAERSTESFAKSRDKAQAEYVEDFFGAVVTFLAFRLLLLILVRQGPWQ